MVIATRIPPADRTVRYFSIEKKRIQEQVEKAIEAGKEAKQKPKDKDEKK